MGELDESKFREFTQLLIKHGGPPVKHKEQIEPAKVVHISMAKYHKIARYLETKHKEQYDKDWDEDRGILPDRNINGVLSKIRHEVKKHYQGHGSAHSDGLRVALSV